LRVICPRITMSATSSKLLKHWRMASSCAYDAAMLGILRLAGESSPDYHFNRDDLYDREKTNE